MKLNIKDRIYIPQICGEQNSYADFINKRSIIGKIQFTDQDKEFYEIKEDPENNRVTWNIVKDTENPLEANFTDAEMAYLRKSCEAHGNDQAPDDFWLTVDKIYAS